MAVSGDFTSTCRHPGSGALGLRGRHTNFGGAATVSREERGRSAPVAVRRYAEWQLKMLIAEAARSAPKSICLSETTHPCALVPPFQQLGEDVFCGSREHHAAPAQVDR